MTQVFPRAPDGARPAWKVPSPCRPFWEIGLRAHRQTPPPPGCAKFTAAEHAAALWAPKIKSRASVLCLCYFEVSTCLKGLSRSRVGSRVPEIVTDLEASPQNHNSRLQVTEVTWLGEAWGSWVFPHETPHLAEQEAPTRLPPPPREKALVSSPSPRSPPRPSPPHPSRQQIPFTPWVGRMEGSQRV